MTDENEIKVLKEASADTLRRVNGEDVPHKDDLSAPYSFVPINETVLTVDSPSHARPVQDGVSGSITVEFENETPFLVSGLDRKNDRHIQIGGTDYVPGASLRGLLRSVVETVAFGRLNFSDPHPAAVRDFNSKTWKNLAGNLREPAKAGWLFKLEKGTGSEKVIEYHIVDAECTIPVPISEICGTLSCDIEDWHCWSLHERLGKLASNNMDGVRPASEFRLGCVLEGRGQLIISGQAPDDEREKGKFTKEQEYLALWPEGAETRLIPARTAENFLNSLARDSASHSGAPVCNISALEQSGPMKRFGRGSLKDQLADPARHGLPVFMTKPENGSLDNPGLSLTAFYRLAYRNNFKDALERAQPDNKQDPNKLDMAEALFGWAPPEVSQANANLRGAREKSWRGRVRVGFAERKDGSGKTITKTLPGISPRPSFFPFYLRPGKDGAKHPVDLDNPAAIPAGRKRYPARNGTTPAPSIEGNDQNQTLNFFERGQTFTAELRLHNARPEEAGALIWAITLGQLPQDAPGDGTSWGMPDDAGLRHMMGRGRNFGHGQIKIRIANAKLRDDIKETHCDLSALVERFKAWVAEGLAEAGEDVTNFDDREEVQRFLGTCHAQTGKALEDRLRYTGQQDGASDSQGILDAHCRIKSAAMAGKPHANAPRRAGREGFIGLPDWPRFDWRNAGSGSENG